MKQLYVFLILLQASCSASLVLNWGGCYSHVYIDGNHHGHSGCWGQKQITIPEDTNHIWFYSNYYNYYQSNGKYYYFVASYSNGLSTSDIQHLWCTYSNSVANYWWNKSDFDDSQFYKPELLETNSKGPYKSSLVSSDARWVGSSYRNSYCRHNLKMECPGFKLLPSLKIDYSVVEKNDKREIEMRCDITNSSNIDTTDVKYDVSIYLDNTLLKSYSGENALTPDDMPAKISESDGLKINSTLKCELSLRNVTEDLSNSTHVSNSTYVCKRTASYYLGFEVISENLMVYEGGNSVKYEIRPTVPILCPIGDDECKLVLTPTVQTKYNSPAVCSDGTIIDQVVFKSSQCGISIGMTSDTTTTYSVDLAAANDGIYDGDHDVQMHFHTPQIHSFHSLWQGYELPLVNINIKDKDSIIAGKVCRAVNDPHMTTFDGRPYEHQIEGEFILYRHKTKPIEVQAYFKKCWYNSAVCVCGAAIRAGGQLFIYDQCRDNKPQRMKLYECDGQGLNVVKLPGRHSYRIQLPTGTKVELYSTYILIYPSVTDLHNTEGLCGTLNGDSSDDFLMRDGTTESVKTYPLQFSNSWRVRADESLYKGKLPAASKSRRDTSSSDTLFCTCNINKVTNRIEAQCGADGETAVQNCIEKANDETLKHQGKCLKRKKRSPTKQNDDTEDDVQLFIYDISFVAKIPSWTKEWTRSKAVTYCTNYITNVGGTKTCIEENLGNVDEAIESCVTDIEITGDTVYSSIHLQAVLSTCMAEILKNMTYYSYDQSSSGGPILKLPSVLLKDICPSNCNGNGACVNGKCQCNGNFVGNDCTDDKHKVPTLFDFPNQGLCDIQERPCRYTPVYGNYFIESDAIVCKIKVQKIMKDNKWIEGNMEVTKPEFDHWQRIMCPLPALDDSLGSEVLALAYTLSISNDGLAFSDIIKLRVYDSMHVNCSSNLECKYINADNTESTQDSTTDSLTSVIIAVSVISTVTMIVIIVIVLVCLKKTKYKNKPPRSVAVEKPMEKDFESLKEPVSYISSTDLFVADEYVATTVAPLSTSFDFKKFRPRTGIKRNTQLEPIQKEDPEEF